MNNLFAEKTIQYIWSHPNNKNKKIQSILKFIGWQFYKRLFKQHIDIQLIPEVKIRCYPDSYSASAALYCGLYDYDEMNFLLRYLRDSDSFLDIGANVEIYTLLAASKIKSGLIYSFEALPKNVVRLRENLELNRLQQVTPLSLAISDSTGSITLNLAEGDSMPFITPEATTTNLAQNSVSATRSPTAIQVPTDTLDNIFKDNSIANLTLAKMDIEGAEILAFKGATSLLEQKRPHVWILEILDSVNHFGYQKHDILNLLQNYGYSLYSYKADNNQLKSITVEQKQGNNVLAIADSELDFVRDRLS
ncbi:MAG: FkbM family methyltransferase [Richelia sp. RM2_1_2]|nr:FkbM family methyltransferase [Richelia sp. RM2_1_2]